jgi:DNA-binding GntR family transcriptional regulator
MQNADGETIDTISDVVLRKVRADIISGVLKPGSKIKLEQAKERYSISVSSMREILCRLAAENLVRAEGQKGFEVSPTSRRELRELADLRIVLETHAMQTSLPAGDLEWEGRIVEAYHKLSAAERILLSGDVSRTIEWVRYDWEFHRSIVSACGSITLMANLSSVFDRFLRYHLLARSFRGEAVALDHKQLVDAALAKDVEAARKIISQHVLNGMQSIEHLF